MKKILIINCHPNPESFNKAIVDSYLKGAKQGKSLVKTIVIAELQFNPSLESGYQKRVELEADLVLAQELIKWADHLVWVHPVWWGGLPAIAKGFIDRVFLPGFAFKYRENSVWWDKLLAGKTAHIITTLDQPSWYYRFVFGRPSINQLKKSTLQFCGIRPVRTTSIGPIKNSSPEQRLKWLNKIETLATKEANN
jgi:NAD(P)H dehydrogenase (quinone)